MSKATPTPACEIARDPTDIYDIVVLRSPTVCSTCHERIRDKHELDAEASHDGLGSGNKPTAVLERAGAGEIGHDAEDMDDYGASKRHPTRTFCGECGRPSGATPSDTPDLGVMLERVPALVKALQARGLEPDVDSLYDAVRHLKQSQEYHARVGDIWRAAVAVAVGQGGGGS